MYKLQVEKACKKYVGNADFKCQARKSEFEHYAGLTGFEYQDNPEEIREE